MPELFSGGICGGGRDYFHTMRHQLYFPPRQADQVAWLRQFRHVLPDCIERLEAVQPLDSALQDEVLRDLDWLIFVMGPGMTGARVLGKAMTSFQRALLMGDARGGKPVSLPALSLPVPPAGPPPRAGALKRVFMLVQMLKHHPAFSKEMGTQLGVLGNRFVKDARAPTFKLWVQRGAQMEETHGRFKRFGRKMVYIETRRGDGQWEKLGMGLYAGPRFVDKRPLLVPGTPEVREYRMCFSEEDKPAGEWSPTASVTVSP